VTTTGYACDVDDEPEEPIIEEPIIEPPSRPTPTPNPDIPIKSLLEIDTSIDMTVEEGNWLQENVIKSRKLKLLFRN
jgi:hypothetical protein